MSIVKPPSFEELVETYGSPKNAVLHLIEVGFSPEQIEWKMGVPYHRIRLYIEGVEPKGGVPFSKIVEVYERLALLRGKKGKETELAKFFKNPELTLEIKARFTLGVFTDETLKIGPGLIERSISLATGAPISHVRKLLIDYGEHGEVAYLLKNPRDSELMVEEVYEAIRLLPSLKRIRERELLISSLLRVSAPTEAKYIVRLLLGDLKLGYYARTVVRAAARAYEVPPELIENACAILGLTEGVTLASEGLLKLSEVKMRPGQFIKPQLAHLYEPDKVVYPVRAEYKLDGSRLQCLPRGAMVLSASPTKIEEIDVGQVVIGASGKHTKVLETFERDYEGKTIEIDPLRGWSLKVTPDHPILAIKGKRCHWGEGKLRCRKNCTTRNVSCKKYYRSYTKEWIPAERLSTNDFVFIPKLRDEHETKELLVPKIGGWGKHHLKEKVKIDEDFLELSGWYVAEGYSDPKYGNISFGFNEYEIIPANRVQVLLKKVFNIPSSRRVKGGAIEVYTRSRRLAKFLSDLFCSEASKKKLPEFIMREKKERLKKFIYALFKGDGYISSERYYFSYKTSSKTLSIQIFELLTKVSVLSRVTEYEGKRGGTIRGRQIVGQENFQIQVTGYDAYKLREYLGLEKIGKSKKTYWEDEDFFYVPIKRIKIGRYRGKVYNLETEDATYCSPFIIHNCHKWGTQIWLYSRRGVEKSRALPEIVEMAENFRAQSCVVDGEVIAIDDFGNPLPFQTLLERTVPRELAHEELEEGKGEVKVTIKVFDILFINGQELVDLPFSMRQKYLLEVVPAEYVVEGLDCQNEVELMRFYQEALKKKFEGIVVKNLTSPYEIGQRTYTWLKLKPERDTIDCTIVKALYGKGKRAGLYSSFLLAVRDPSEKKLYTIGRVSNLPEETMDALRTIIENTKTSEDDEGVFVKPSVVAEATYQEIQETDEYTSGYALRVPKIVRFRTDKTVNETDSVGKLKKLYELQYERYPIKSL